jgi:hypothetical protein
MTPWNSLYRQPSFLLTPVAVFAVARFSHLPIPKRQGTSYVGSCGMGHMISGGISMAAKRINIHTASKDELAALPRIGHERAETLVEQRPFCSWGELDELPGFDAALIEDIQDSPYCIP